MLSALYQNIRAVKHAEHDNKLKQANSRKKKLDKRIGMKQEAWHKN